MMGTLDLSSGVPSLARRLAKGGAARLGTRWAIGAIPVVGIVYGGYDASRTMDRVLRLPLPADGAREDSPA
jgi:hypothetical protein